MPKREEQAVSLTKKAYEILDKAKKNGETLSDVVVRLSETKITGLQRRGEKKINTSDGNKFAIWIDQDKCAGAESCVEAAPSVFALDPSELGGFRRGALPLGMREVDENSVDTDTILVAAKSCPYRSIHIKDLTTGEELAGYP